MRKGQKKRIWTPEQKSEIVHKHLDNHNPFHDKAVQAPPVSDCCKNWQALCGHVAQCDRDIA